MKYSTKLSDTIHILIFIALGDDEQLSSTKIAESIKTNPAYVRQLMATLKNAGIVVNTQGHANAALAKSADKINMYDIYRAVEGDKPLLHQPQIPAFRMIQQKIHFLASPAEILRLPGIIIRTFNAAHHVAFIDPETVDALHVISF